jgi:hypothetical protein
VQIGARLDEFGDQLGAWITEQGDSTFGPRIGDLAQASPRSSANAPADERAVRRSSR